ncbi:MAG: CHAT domain-containing protein, partial [Thermoanaerobaculia bacterium]
LAGSISEELAHRGQPLALTTMRQLAAKPHLGAAIRSYADGRSAMMRGAYGEAETLLRSTVETMDREHFAFAIEARIALTSNHIYQGDYKRALADAREALRADLSGFPAAEAKMRWLEGLSLQAHGRLIEGLDAYRRSEALFDQLGETENLAAVRGLIAEALDYAGDFNAAERNRQLALAGLMQLGDSDRIPSILSEAADSALRRGNLDRALSLQRRVGAHARAAGNNIWMIHAALDCSEILCAKHDFIGAEHEIRDAATRLRSIEDPAMRKRLSADLQLAGLRATPQAANLSAYDDIVALLRTEDNHYHIAKLLLEKGERLRQRGELRDSEKTLRAALDELESLRDRVDDVIARSQYFETGHRIVNSLVLVLIDQGRTTDALLALQRASGRTVLESVAERNAVATLSVADLLDAVPPHAVAIEYKFAGNRLFTWIIRQSGVTFAESRADRATLHRTAAELQQAVLHNRIGDFDRASATLYSALVAPIERELRDITSLVVIPDAELSDFPFEAVRANPASPFLIERTPVSYAPSLAVLKFRAHATSRHMESAALLGDPRIDTTRFRDLPPLSASVEEVHDAAAVYLHSRTFLGADATRAALLQSLRSEDVVHIAAHAIENGDSPFLSMLLLSPSGSDSGVVYAHDIAGLGVTSRIVVLAGCATAVGARLDTEGTTSLATAFLAGGAEGVVATCWPIRDDTASTITTAFHRGLHNGVPAAAALRQAKIEALHSHPERLDWVPYQLFIASKAVIEGGS